MAISPTVEEGNQDGSLTTSPPAPTRARGGWHAAQVVLATLTGALLILVLLAAIFLAVVSRTSDRGVPRVFGQTFLVILSGSMTPTFDAGDLIVDRTLSASQAAHLRKGQVITFEEGPKSAPASVLITHRIYRVRDLLSSKTHQETRVYETKGDANPVADGNSLASDQILGVYEFRVPFGGYVLNVLHQPVVFILLVSSPFLLLVAGEATRRWKMAGPGGNTSGGSKS
ncbi:MAG: signal peptidase I [Candidatus Dormiibacterota bacterium]